MLEFSETVLVGSLTDIVDKNFSLVLFRGLTGCKRNPLYVGFIFGMVQSPGSETVLFCLPES